MRELSTWSKIHELHSVVILAEGAKTPIHKNWNERSIILFEVQDAFRKNFNMGIRCDNLTVLDFDSKQPARDFFQKHKSSITCITETRRGVHMFFRHTNVGNKQCEEFDVRAGQGGYVVAPGSVVNGHLYRFVPGYDRLDLIHPCPINFAPPSGPQSREVEKGEMIARARAYLKSIPPAVKGTRDNACFKCACILIQKFNLSQDQAFGLLLEFNDRCQPPIKNIAKLRRKLAEAERLRKPNS